MNQEQDKITKEFYDRLKVELNNSNSWPAEYLFKFIVPTVNDNVEKVENSENQEKVNVLQEDANNNIIKKGLFFYLSNAIHKQHNTLKRNTTTFFILFILLLLLLVLFE